MPDIFWTFITLMAMVLGVIGTIVPLLPGTTLILVMALLHKFLMVPDNSIGWSTVVALTILYVVSVAVDWLSSAAGAKRFGASRLAMGLSVLGAFVGIFFGLIGLFLGPLVGALVGELIARGNLNTAAPVAWGTLLGTVLGILGRMGIAVVMVGVFVLGAWRGW